VPVVREDRSKLDRLLKFLNAKQEIHVGILQKGDEQHNEEDLTIAALASIHEFGLGDQEERPFIRGWYDARKAELSKIAIARYQQAFIAGQDPKIISQQLATYFAADCQERMVNGWTYPDISDLTKDRKGSSTPLIDTNALRAHITGEAI